MKSPLKYHPKAQIQCSACALVHQHISPVNQHWPYALVRCVQAASRLHPGVHCFLFWAPTNHRLSVPESDLGLSQIHIHIKLIFCQI